MAKLSSTDIYGDLYVDGTIRENGTSLAEKYAALSHGTHLTLGTGSGNAFRGDYGNTAYNHSQTAHAPSNAQKNSDITKAEIEAKLTGAITSHTHSYLPLSGGELTGRVRLTTAATTTDASSPTQLAYGLLGSYGTLKVLGNTDTSAGADNEYVHIAAGWGLSPAADKGITVYGTYANCFGKKISTEGHTHNYAGSPSAGGAAYTANILNTDNRMEYGWNGLNYFNLSGTAGNAAKANDTPTTAWWHIVRCNHANATGYYTDIAVPFNDTSMYYKRITSGAVQNGGWVKMLDSLNWSEYAAAKSHGTHVSYGGNGSATTVSRSDHTHSHLDVKGTNTITSTTNDTTSKWGAQGTSVHWYTTAGQLVDQPSQWGYLLNVGSGSEVHQLWMTQASGDLKHRGGNASGWSGSWRTLLDTSNFTSHVTPSAIGAASSSHGTHLELGTTSSTAYRGDRGNTAYNHSQAAHAPTNAQKNSDITKAEIEAKLTGAITSHSHAAVNGYTIWVGSLSSYNSISSKSSTTLYFITG